MRPETIQPIVTQKVDDVAVKDCNGILVVPYAYARHLESGFHWWQRHGMNADERLSDAHDLLREIRDLYIPNEIEDRIDLLIGVTKTNDSVPVTTPEVSTENQTISDGFGSSWEKKCACGNDMEVVRPGKAQCSRCG